MSNITYETLYGILRKEKYQIELQELKDTFFQDVTDYLKEKGKILESQNEKGIFQNEVKKTRKQIENIKKILKELYEKRENKLLQLALLSVRSSSKDDFSNILLEEKQLYLDLKNTLITYKKDILSNVLSQKLPTAKPKDIKAVNINSTKLVKFLNAVPKFVGSDLQIYGPFEPEDVANLPIKVANVLITRKRVEGI